MKIEVFTEYGIEGFKLDPEVKEKWLTALRSGEYEQGDGQLCYNGKFCCLGVLNDVLDLGYPEGYGYLSGCHPDARAKIKEKYGIDLGAIDQDTNLDELALILPEDIQSELAHMNDCGRTFVEIADYIEAHL